MSQQVKQEYSVVEKFLIAIGAIWIFPAAIAFIALSFEIWTKFISAVVDGNLFDKVQKGGLSAIDPFEFAAVAVAGIPFVLLAVWILGRVQKIYLRNLYSATDTLPQISAAVPHEQGKRRRSGVSTVLLTIGLIWALPIAIALTLLSFDLWPRIITDMENGKFFGHFQYFGLPPNTPSELLILAILSLPIVLPLVWVFSRLYTALTRLFYPTPSR